MENALNAVKVLLECFIFVKCYKNVFETKKNVLNVRNTRSRSIIFQVILIFLSPKYLITILIYSNYNRVKRCRLYDVKICD